MEHTNDLSTALQAAVQLHSLIHRGRDPDRAAEMIATMFNADVDVRRMYSPTADGPNVHDVVKRTRYTIYAGDDGVDIRLVVSHTDSTESHVELRYCGETYADWYVSDDPESVRSEAASLHPVIDTN